jgi:hypothetical protein
MNAPQRITVRLGEDLNWWIESADDDQTASLRGVLDPRQVSHLVQVLDSYRAYGYRPQQLAAAFFIYHIDAEIAEDQLRLTATGESILEEGAEAFALPSVGHDDDGPYFEWLDTIAAGRVRKLNATHHYTHNCTDEEMTEELKMLDADRYFSDDTIHAFDEITEILEWSPAEWDESAEA